MHKYYNNFLHPPHFSLTYNRFNQYPNKAPTIDGNFAYASLTAAGRLQHFAFIFALYGKGLKRLIILNFNI
jgi:hypothetical protein